jgi:hypothetical protein
MEQGMIENSLELSDTFNDYDHDALKALVLDYANSLSRYKATVADADKKLGMLQRLTEDIFLKIGDKLPDISSSLTDSENEARRLLDYFKEQSGFFTHNTEDYNSDLAKLNIASSYLLTTVEEQGKAFEQMSGMMARIENIKQSIESVRDFSVEMETLSINAAIIAIKAGDEGRSLNPITAELNKMANAAIHLIDEITSTAVTLTEKYNSFQELSDNQVILCKEAVEKTNAQVSSRYKVLQKNLSNLTKWLDDMLDSLVRSKNPICNIMNELQVQDLVKQCTDHVRISLETAGAESVSDSDPNRYYDAVYFQEKVPLLCVELLDDIDDRLGNSINGLSMELESIDSISNEVLSSNSNKNKSNNSDGDLQNDLDNSFDMVRSVALDMATVMQNISNSWDELLATTVELENTLTLINEQFARLKKITNFHLINIPIKIEVARNTWIEQESDITGRVEGLADFIESELKRSQATIAADCKFLNQMSQMIGKRKENISVQLDVIARDVEALIDNFMLAKKEVNNTFHYVNEHMTHLSDVVHGSLRDLETMQGLIGQNKEIKSDLKTLAGMASDAREAVELRLNRSDWEIRDSKLSDIVEKFTTLAHKKIAENICEMSIEGGNMEGDIVLF